MSKPIDLSHLNREIDDKTFGPAVTFEGGEEPALRVYHRLGLPKKEPELSEAINAMSSEERTALKEAIRLERTHGRAITDEEYEAHQARAAEAEAQEAEAAADRARVAADIRKKFGDVPDLAAAMARQVGVDLDRD